VLLCSKFEIEKSKCKISVSLRDIFKFAAGEHSNFDFCILHVEFAAGRHGEPAEVKHLSKRRKRKQ
jgi:hypothetical protein